MNTLELRHIISEHLAHIDDESFLNTLKTIVESKVANSTYQLSDIETRRVESSRQEVLNGQTLSDEELQLQVEQWLNTK